MVGLLMDYAMILSVKRVDQAVGAKPPEPAGLRSWPLLHCLLSGHALQAFDHWMCAAAGSILQSALHDPRSPRTVMSPPARQTLACRQEAQTFGLLIFEPRHWQAQRRTIL